MKGCASSMLIRISEAAKRLGIHPNTLRHLEKRGVIKPERDWSGYRIFSERDIEEISKKLFPGRTQANG